MNLSKGIRIALFLTLALMALPGSGTSDIIFLKDGTSVEAQKVWEDDGLVRFSLPNYDGIIITYSKEIIERIERGQQRGEGNQRIVGEKSQASSKGVANPSFASDTNHPSPPVEQNSPAVSGDAVPTAEGASVTSPAEIEIDMALVESVAGIEFYNARRAFKYQTGPDAKFHTFKAAIDDLAAKFDKDPYWIGQKLGNTNDLGQIYINLNRKAEPTESEAESADDTAGILFYDPRRTYKYGVAADSKHRTLDEAISSLASQYSRSPEWVIDHLGETNNLTEIHQNLQIGVSTETSP